jgi:hypothetical protein
MRSFARTVLEEDPLQHCLKLPSCEPRLLFRVWLWSANAVSGGGAGV